MAHRIQLEEVSHRYGDGYALAGVSFEVAVGEVLVLVGGSGSGKTTALKTINRLIEPTGGTVRVDGQDVRAVPAHELRRKVGLVFQGAGLFPHMSVARNIGITPELLGWNPDRIRTRVRELLELVELDPELGERLPSELSGGQRQRVGVARALAARPTVMLLDEPFGALDPPTRGRLQGSFRRIRASEELTAVFVTHDLAEAVTLGDRVGVMNRGKLVQLGTARELFEAPADAYVESLVASAREQAGQLNAIIGGPNP